MKVIFIILLSIGALSGFSQEKNKIKSLISDSEITKEPSDLKILRQAVEVNPNHPESHEAYINRARLDTNLLIGQYASWMKRYPKSSAIPLAIGTYFSRKHSPKTKRYLLEAVKINPNLVEAWRMLSVDAEMWGEKDAQLEYLKKGIKADPRNVENAILYMLFFKESDRIKSDSLALDIALRFPNNEAAAFALYALARDEDNADRKIAYYDQLFKRHSTLQPAAFRYGMSNYFSMLINSDTPEKAFDLALNMIFIVDKNKLEWKHKIKVAKDFMDVKKLLLEQNYEKALVVLNDIQLKNGFSNSAVDAQESLFLRKAEVADLLNDTQSAYDSVAVVYSKAPSDKLRTVMLRYATKLGKDSILVDQEIRTMRYASAVPCPDFSFQTVESGSKISLEGLKGKIVLITLWFPGCGPCKEEFPHLESVVKKFNINQIAYIGINGISEQDEFVIPFIRSNGYSFTAVIDDKEWDRTNRASAGYPRNYLIDQNGLIIATKFKIDENNERMLELLISELLNGKAD